MSKISQGGDENESKYDPWLRTDVVYLMLGHTSMLFVYISEYVLTFFLQKKPNKLWFIFSFSLSPSNDRMFNIGEKKIQYLTEVQLTSNSNRWHTIIINFLLFSYLTFDKTFVWVNDHTLLYFLSSLNLR